MNFPMIRSFQGAISCFVKKIVAPQTIQLPISYNRGIHHLCNHNTSTLTVMNNQTTFKPLSFLTPILPLFNQVCGMKQRGHLQLRCKGCYYVSRQGRLYVMCKLKPRHKQQQMMKSFKNRRILTFAQQKKIRDWYK